MTTDVLIYDAFTDTPGKGNPAGIVLNAEKFTESDMQRIAATLGFNETAFICVDTNGAIAFRYFTPGHEVPMCGHATVAGMYALAERGLVRSGIIRIGTGSGKLAIKIITEDRIRIGMTQSPYLEETFHGSPKALARMIGLEADALDDRYPIRYASTGLWTLLVPVKRLSDFKRMQPLTKEFPRVLTENGRASIHPFCLETYDPSCQMHGRHFSSPYSGTVEDAVTGTASGAMGEYWIRHICPSNNTQCLRIEQGHEIEREGTVVVEVSPDPAEPVTIYGTAVYADKRTLSV